MVQRTWLMEWTQGHQWNLCMQVSEWVYVQSPVHSYKKRSCSKLVTERNLLALCHSHSPSFYGKMNRSLGEAQESGCAAASIVVGLSLLLPGTTTLDRVWCREEACELSLLLVWAMAFRIISMAWLWTQNNVSHTFFPTVDSTPSYTTATLFLFTIIWKVGNWKVILDFLKDRCLSRTLTIVFLSSGTSPT